MSNHLYKINSVKSQDKLTIAINATQPIPNRKSAGSKILMHYRNKPVIDHIIDLINRTFEEPEIIIITGFAAKSIYVNRPKNVKLVENQLFDSTRECENVRLVAQSTTSKNIIFLPDNMMYSKEDLIKLSKQSMVVTSEHMLSEMVPIFENGMLYNFIFHRDKHDRYYANAFSLSGRELDYAVNYSFKNMYSTFFDTELLSDVVRSGGIIRELHSPNAEIII